MLVGLRGTIDAAADLDGFEKFTFLKGSYYAWISIHVHSHWPARLAIDGCGIEVDYLLFCWM